MRGNMTRIVRLPPFLAATLLSLVVALGAPAAAAAEVAGGGPDETAAQAYGPLTPGVPYSGAFAGGSDVDYLSLAVTQAGETLGFSVQNTTRSCQDPNGAGCPVYATLMDSSGQNQLGGSSSDAGTIATSGDTESFAWRFATPGTYYVLMESNGDLPAGSPSYTLRLTSGAAPPPLLRSLSASLNRRGTAVTVSVRLGQAAARLRAELDARRVDGSTAPIAARTARGLPVGAHRLVLSLPAPYVRRLATGRRLTLLLRITVRPQAGRSRVYTRRLTLRR